MTRAEGSDRPLLPRKAWREIRSHALAMASNTCAACDQVVDGGRYMVCDELWSYDEINGVATLAGFRIPRSN